MNLKMVPRVIPTESLKIGGNDPVDPNKQAYIDGSLAKASNHLASAREHAKSYYYCSDCIQDAQACVELSVKALLSLLEIEYPRTHGWDEKELRKVAEQIEKRKLLTRLNEQYLNHINLPRLLILVNLWDQFYIQAKYGIEAGNLAPAQKLFTRPEAELAIAHADECLHAATAIRHAGGEKLSALLARG
jgi:HEPN domain-containing protein